MDNSADYRGKVLVARLFVKIKGYKLDRDHISGERVHYFEADQCHGNHDMICDWQHAMRAQQAPLPN